LKQVTGQAEDFGKSLQEWLRINRTEIRQLISDVAALTGQIGSAIGQLADMFSFALKLANVGSAIRKDAFAMAGGDFSYSNMDKIFRPKATDLYLGNPGDINLNNLSVVRPGGGGNNGYRPAKKRGGRQLTPYEIQQSKIDLLFFANQGSQIPGGLEQAQSDIDRAMKALSDRQELGPTDERLGRATRSALTRDYKDQEEQRKQYEKSIQTLSKIKPVLSEGQAFLKGFNSETRSLAQSFEQLGASVSSAFGDVGNLFSGLASAIKSFFNDVAGSVLRNAAGSLLGPLFGGLGNLGGGSNGASIFTGGFSGGGGAASVLGAAAGGVGSLFSGSGNLATFSGAASSRVQQQQLIGDVAKWIGPSVPMTAGKVSILGGLKQAFSNKLSTGILGGTLGMQLGGQSILGNALGGVGGAIGGIALSSAISGAGVLGLSALATTGIGAAIAAPLLIASIFSGKAAQRRADEPVADQYVNQYWQQLDALTRDVKANRLDGDSALAQAIADRQQAVSQISALKTGSVVKSRLHSNIGSIDYVDSHSLQALKEAIGMQGSRRDLASRYVPEFATGGLMPHTGYALLHANEVVLNKQQQAQIGQQALESAGVPGLRGGSGSSGAAPVYVNISIGKQDQTEIVSNGIVHPNARKAVGQALSNLTTYRV
jgi:hypothetical protein